MNRRIPERLQSVVDVFMDACQVWVNFANDDSLLTEIRKTQQDLNNLDVDECNEEALESVQEIAMKMLNQMNESLKSSGFGGLLYKGIKH